MYTVPTVFTMLRFCCDNKTIMLQLFAFRNSVLSRTLLISFCLRTLQNTNESVEISNYDMLI